MAEPKRRNTPPPPQRQQRSMPRPPAEEKKPAPAKPRNEQNQFWSIMLFAAGVLMGLMVVIPGSDGWNSIHKFLLGMFGVAAFFVPVILVYTSLQIGMEKSQESVAGRAVWELC